MNEDNEEYILSGVNPSLDVAKTNPILNELNKDGKSGFNSFAVGTSKYLLYVISCAVDYDIYSCPLTFIYTLLILGKLFIETL